MDKPQPVSLQDILQQVEANLLKDIQDKQALLQYHHLPSVMGHPSLLVQLFQNLISNSLKFVQSDTQPLISVVFEKESRGQVQIAVQDNGIGIPKEDQNRVFELFSRLHSSKDYAGSGVGLAACQKIIQHHGGHIWLTSEEGAGTRVHLLLPAG
ncbi:MAG: ATP-binding protein [Saprospiraceae bacterium]